MNRSSERLSFFLPTLEGGGAERTTLKLAKGVAERGYPVDIVLAQAMGPLLSEVPQGLRLVDLKAKRTLTSLPGLIRYLQTERPLAMLSALNRANILAIWARRLARVPTRIFVSERNTLSLWLQKVPQWHRALTVQLIKYEYPRADGIVAVSRGVADDLARVAGLPRNQITVIYNPIVTPELRQKAQRSLDHLWFKPGEPPVVLAVGSLTIQKDFPTLIRAFARVRKQRPLRLLILGEGAERARLEALVKQLNLQSEVGLPGWVDNPYPYMRRADIFVLSSKWEGLPGVLIEALYCGPSLISTDCPSGPREILMNGEYGRLVPVGDVDGLAKTIESALDDEKSDPPPESWRRFEMDVVVDQYLSLLRGKL